MATGQLGEDSPPNCAAARDLRSTFEIQGSRFKVQGSQPRRAARAWILDVGCWMFGFSGPGSLPGERHSAMEERGFEQSFAVFTPEHGRKLIGTSP